MELIQIIILIFNGLLTIVFALIIYTVKGITRRIDTLEIDVKGIKGNYLERFNAVLKNQSDVKIELIKQQFSVKEELVKQQVQVKEELIKHNVETKDELLGAINQINIAFAGHTAKENNN